MSKIRAIRLNPEEEKLVQSFLQKNPLFDFTTLVRASLREFMRNPQVRLTALDEELFTRMKLSDKKGEKKISESVTVGRVQNVTP